MQIEKSEEKTDKLNSLQELKTRPDGPPSVFHLCWPCRLASRSTARQSQSCYVRVRGSGQHFFQGSSWSQTVPAVPLHRFRQLGSMTENRWRLSIYSITVSFLSDMKTRAKNIAVALREEEEHRAARRLRARCPHFYSHAHEGGQGLL